jgi:hypothetical protein
MGFVERFNGLVARGNGLVARRGLVVRGRGLLARRGFVERAIGVRLSGFAVAPLERRRGFQSAFLTMAVRLIPCSAFFSVFGGLGNGNVRPPDLQVVGVLKARALGRRMFRGI